MLICRRVAGLCGLLMMVGPLVAACGNSNSTTTDHTPAPSAKAAPTTHWLVPYTGVLMFCYPREPDYSGSAAVAAVRLEQLTMPGDKVIASHMISLPSGTEPSVPCSGSSGDAIRREFNKDLTRMAVTVDDPRTGAKLASYADTATGKIAPPRSPQSGFGSTPDQEGAVFDQQNGTLWFVDDGTKRIENEDPDTGKILNSRPLPDSASFIAVGHAYQWPLSGSLWGVTPDGSRLVYTPDGSALSYRIIPTGVNPDAAAQSSTVGVPCGFVDRWVDNQRLLCDNGGNDTASSTTQGEIDLVTFSSDYSSVTCTDLLPQNNLTDYSAVPSVNGSLYAFLTQQGNQVTAFVATLYHGSTPDEVGVVATTTIDQSGNIIGAPYLIQWNH